MVSGPDPMPGSIQNNRWIVDFLFWGEVKKSDKHRASEGVYHTPEREGTKSHAVSRHGKMANASFEGKANATSNLYTGYTLKLDTLLTSKPESCLRTSTSASS